MSEFQPTLMAALILAAVSHFSSSYDRHRLCYRRKDRVFYTILSVVLTLFVGLRTHYNDTQTYLHAYSLIDPSVSLSVVDLSLGNNPGFNMTNILLKRAGVSGQSYLMLYAVVTVSINLWFLRKYSTNLWLSVFLYITVAGYTNNLAAMKQCVAVALCLVGVDRAIRKKWISFVLWVLLGSLFHAYALMYLLTPLLMFRPWSRKTYILILGTLIVGALLQPLMGTIINITSMLGEEYSAETFAGEGINPFRLAVVLVPVLLSFMCQKHIARENDPAYNLLLNLVTMNALIMYIALFGTANYFARLANYFVIFHAVTIPWLFRFFETNSRKFLTGCAIAGYFGFFYYGNVIYQPLDYYYAGITLLEYLQSLS